MPNNIQVDKEQTFQKFDLLSQGIYRGSHYNTQLLKQKDSWISNKPIIIQMIYNFQENYLPILVGYIYD